MEKKKEMNVRKLIGENLSKSYGERQVVSNVSLEIAPGEIVGLLGPNGAGKTTTFYMMVGLVRPQEGKIFCDEIDVTTHPIHRRAKMGIGYLPQESSIFRELSVRENILAALECTDLKRDERKKRLMELLSDFGLEHVQYSKGRELSGGERRRAEMARTLAISPKFILLDEPFAGVDPLAVSDIQEIIISLKKRNIGVLITDHNVRETLGVVDRGYIMKEGKLLINGRPEEILESEVARKYYLGEDFKL